MENHAKKGGWSKMGVISSFLEGKENLFKVTIVGDGGTGKTSIIEQYLGKGFSVGYKLTIGTNISTHTSEIDGKKIKFQIWDLAGQQRFEFVRSTFYRGSHALVMVFDVTRPKTLENLREWKFEALRNIGKEPPFPVILLGNKADLQHKNLISQDMISHFRDELKMDFKVDVPFLYTSALSGMNVCETFEILGLLLTKNEGQIDVSQRNSPRVNAN